MTIAIGYVRVSTTGQATDGVSLADQETKIRAYCTALGITLVGIEIDAGLSASSLRRPGLQRALAALKSNKADTLIVASLSRLSRSVADLAILVEKTFNGRRAKSLISLSEMVDTRSASGRGTLAILGAVAQLERELIAERTASALAHLRAQGRHCGGPPPLGYAVEDGRLVEVPEELEVVREVRSLQERGMSIRAIVATLQEAGRQLRGGQITIGRVQRVLGARERPAA